MRVVFVLAAVGAVLAAVAFVVEPLLDDPPRGRDQTAAEPPESGPFAVAARPTTPGSARVGAIADLARRLRADVLVPEETGRGPRPSDDDLARRMIETTCRDTTRDCRQAVGTSVIRRVWASTSRRGDPVRKAERLLGLGRRLSLTSIQVRDSIRAELDSQLTLAIAKGDIGWPRRNAAVTCFDAPSECRLRRP